MGSRSARTSAPPTPRASTAPARSRVSPRAPAISPPPSALPRSAVPPQAMPQAAVAPAAEVVRAKGVLSETTARREQSDRDMRSKRPPAMSFLLRMDTARRVARVLSLLALDFAGVALAIFSALMVKAAVLDKAEVSPALHETQRILAF